MLNSNGSYGKGAKVFWKWGRGKVKGIVKEVYFYTIEKEIKGNVYRQLLGVKLMESLSKY